MAGRGGRGAALQQALLKAQMKKPQGEAAAPAPVPPVVAPAPTPGAAASVSAAGDAPRLQKPSGRGGGRGSLLTSLIKAASSSTPAAGGTGGTVPEPAPATSASTELPDLSSLHVSEQKRERAPTVSQMGKMGKKLSLSANVLELKSIHGGIYQYHVSFVPDVDSRNQRFRLLNQHREQFPVKTFDGSILYLPQKLQNQTLTSTSHDDQPVKVHIKYVTQVPLNEASRVFNVIFRRIMSELQMVQVGRYFYNPNTPNHVPQHKLEIWPGYITAIAEREGGIQLQADVSHRVLRTETVYSYIESTVRNMSSHRGDNAQDAVEKVLLGCTVLTRYNNKTYRVDDIDWHKSPRSEFTNSQGETITFADYYRRAYNKEIQDLKQPLLIHKPKPKGVEASQAREMICLVPELCYMTGLSEEMRSDFRVMKDLALHTRVTPQQRRLAIQKFVQSINSTPAAKQLLDMWGLRIGSDTIQIPGRQLPMETILMGDNRSCSAGPKADWGRDVTRNPVLTPVDLYQWLLVYTRRDSDKVSQFVGMFNRVCRDLGVKSQPPKLVELPTDRTDGYLDAIRKHINPQLQLVVTVMPSQREDRYNAIKRLCCCDSVVPSQVIQGRTIGQPNKLRSVTQKIALQINCKLGGDLWSVRIPMSNFMICGIDTYHEKAQKSRSVGGFVASMNSDCSQWYSRVCQQQAGQELIDGIKVCLTAALKKYHDRNHMLPERIIIFRDGVGDGQLSHVQKFEVDQLLSALRLFKDHGHYDPELCVVIVQKRINTRLFNRLGGGDRCEMDNPPPGTVVDHTVTSRIWYDFFLVSQHVGQGTVSPTHYVVVHDSSSLKPDHVQCLAYKLTHLYYNWPGSVRVPAPCQYAHKLAYLVGQNLRREVAASDRLFYL